MFSLDIIRNKKTTTDEFDLYWRKCANYRFNQIKDMKTTSDILEEWPEYGKPSGHQLVCLTLF